VKAPRIGRPPLAKKERKATLLSVRLTEEERREVERAAKAAGVGLSEWARRVLLTACSARARD
jgi:hypothetical protein